MRILYHHRTLADGAEGIHIAAMVAAFRSLGHEVRVEGLAETEGPLKRLDLLKTAKGALPEWAQELAGAALNGPEFVWARRTLADFAPQLLYKRHARYDVAALVAAHRAGVPSILEVNSLFSQGAYHQFEPLKLRRMAQWFERKALEVATIVVAVSSPLAHQAESLANRHVVVLPNGADPDYFHPDHVDPQRVRDRHHLAPGLIIGWVGILREWHGLDLLLEAVSLVPDAHLLIVGDGPARPALERRAATLGLTERVTITGRIGHPEVRDYVSAFDVAVVADERTGVASPMKLVEYMAMGRAVVAPRLDNIRDLIDEGQDGLLFAQGSAADLGRVLRMAATDSELRLALGRRARAKVEQERNWRAMAQRALRLVGVP